MRLFEDAEREDRWFKAEVNYDPTIALVFQGADHGIQVGRAPAPGYLELIQTWMLARAAGK